MVRIGHLAAVLQLLSLVVTSCDFEAGEPFDAGPHDGCDPLLQDCDAICRADRDCDEELGGYACLMADRGPLGAGTIGSSDASALVATDAAASGRGDESGDDDAGSAEDDADAVDAGPDSGLPPRIDAGAHGPEHGYCALRCATELCIDPTHVCSSERGFCRPGCDAERPSCPAGKRCDPSSRRCIGLDGRCEGSVDCGVFDERLLERGDKRCEDEVCRYVPDDPDAVAASSSPIAARTLAVRQPDVGERVAPESLEDFVFEFDLPAPVMIAVIVERRFKDLADAGNAAVWAAYTTGYEAREGLKLADGGRMDGGKWSPAAPDIQIDVQYLFYVLGMQRGKVVAASDLIPFTVGPPRPVVGDVCDVGTGQFCASDSALLCVRGTCRTPCLSDDDCEPENRSCSPPGRNGVAARVCL